MFRSNFDLLCKNLTYLKEYKQQKKSIFPKIRLNMILMKSNLLKFKKLVDFINRYNIDIVQFRELCIYPGANNIEETKEELISNIDEKNLNSIITDISQQISMLADKGKQIILPSSLAKEQSLDSEKNIIKRHSCSIPFFSYWINYQGKIKVCVSDNDGVAGNIITDSFTKINKNAQKFRKMALKGKCKMNCKANLNTSEVI